MRHWLVLLLVLWCWPALAEPSRLSLPLSSPAGEVSLSFVCRSDGIVGLFVDTSRANRATSGTVTLFTRLDFARRAAHFDVPSPAPDGVLALPDQWIQGGDGAQSGFFISAADVRNPERTAALRAITVRAQLVLLQVATAKFVGVSTGEGRFLVAVDPRALDPSALARCLEHAGLSVARTMFDARRAPAPSRAELTGLCLTLFNRADALAAIVEAVQPNRRERLSHSVVHPTQDQVDCFRPETLDSASILAAAHEASAIAAFDYAGFTSATADMGLPLEAYAELRETWGGRDLPGQREAEVEALRTAKADAMRKLYLQFSRVLACIESLKQSRLEPVDPHRLSQFRSELNRAELGLRGEIDLDALWMDGFQDYQRTTARLRTAAATSPVATLDICSNEATRMETLLARLAAGPIAVPARGAAMVSKAELR